ncbi:glycosyltransferase family 2 protein [Candidatus Pelagibacter ubique]|nr:glycosyltransferase family 2 protein [Candidatus Pelagibacter ubique]
MTKISIVTPTFNEELNIAMLCAEIKKEMGKLNLDYEHIIIDNSSTDNTIKILKEICLDDKKVKVIINSKNYGHIKSPFHGILQSTGDACLLMASDFQDPVELIPQYIKKWQDGSKIVLGKKTTSNENSLMFNIRTTFYNFLNKISETKLTNNTTGSGIFDKSIIEKLRKINDPYPYFRGLLSELGEEIDLIEFNQPKRLMGETKNNFFTLYDIGMLGVVKHSRKPLRYMIIIGFISSLISFFLACSYLLYKIFFWNSFELGVAPIVIGIFAASSIQILLLGLIGEYIGIILIHQRNLPLVYEKQRINFD